MTEEQYVTEFALKQGFENITRVDDMTWAFDGFYFSIDDIKYDIDNEVVAGRIKLFSAEGTNSGKMPSYGRWLAEHFYF